jgi:hypothetical protein
MVVDKRYFPIQTETSCRLKWSWSTIYLTDGSSASCHRSSSGFLDENNFNDFHNLPVKLEARQQMLDSQWPEGGCDYCKNIEDSGGFSDRNFQNSIPNVYPQELDTNQNLLEVDPVVLEIFFNNTCNLSCIYCTEKFSSTIKKENQKFGGPISIEDRDTLNENKYEKLSPLLWKW